MVLSSEFKSLLFPVRVSFCLSVGVINCVHNKLWHSCGHYCLFRVPNKPWHIALLVQKCLQALTEFAAYPKPHMPSCWIHRGLFEALVLLGLGAVSEGLM